jgi:argininosuccinate lyase
MKHQFAHIARKQGFGGRLIRAGAVCTKDQGRIKSSKHNPQHISSEGHDMTDKSIPTSANSANAMWGGRFEGGPDAIMQAINASIGFDRRLAVQDIAGSRAHAAMLAAQGILTNKDAEAIREGLLTVLSEIEGGKFTFRVELEDIHMNVEARLKEIIGEPAGRLHTGRSRNDQVAVDFRMWVRDQCDAAILGLDALMRAFLAQAEAGADWVMPGFTHLQTAQPVTWGHHMLAYVEMFARDKSRYEDARRRMNECPLGAAALAGTSFPLDRDATAAALGFDRPTANSLDSVSDRDFALEFLSASSICAMHLSRFAEELVIWSSAQFRFVRLSDKWTTGSSIMPQKKNPDAAELLRSKLGRILGATVALFTIMKGLALTYSKDMQEDKEQTFDAADSLMLGLAAMTGMVGDMTANRAQLKTAAASGFSTATDLADWLVRELNLPFRDAHHVTGSLVAMAEKQGVDLPDLTLEQMKSVYGGIRADVFDVLGVENSVRSRMSYGGTAPDQVRAQVARWTEILG